MCKCKRERKIEKQDKNCSPRHLAPRHPLIGPTAVHPRLAGQRVNHPFYLSTTRTLLQFCRRSISQTTSKTAFERFREYRLRRKPRKIQEIFKKKLALSVKFFFQFILENKFKTVLFGIHRADEEHLAKKVLLSEKIER